MTNAITFNAAQLEIIVKEYSAIESMSVEHWRKLENILSRTHSAALMQLKGVKNFGYLTKKILKQRGELN